MPKKGQKSGYNIECENCGKDIYQTKTQYNRAKHHFCSNKCQKEFQHKEIFESRECPICGNSFEVSKKSTQKFCSTKCQNEWQKLQIGEKNPRYTQVEIECECCGKPYSVKLYKTENGQHNFCSEKCRRDWYANVWSQSEEWKDISKQRAVKILSDGKIPFTTSTPQITINKLLDSLNIKYENEYSCKYFSIDNYLSEFNLMIEIMGDFWHCNPLKYKNIKQEVQIKRVPKDKAKHTYIKNQYNIEILYLWEDDINNNIDLCKKLILKYISSNGILNNYHSFNYHLENNDLVLSDNLIIPYQDMSSNELTKYKIA